MKGDEDLWAEMGSAVKRMEAAVDNLRRCEATVRKARELHMMADIEVTAARWRWARDCERHVRQEREWE